MTQIFNFTPSQPTADELALLEKAQALSDLERIALTSERGIESFITHAEQGWRIFWTQGASPEVKIQQAGRGALRMFQISAMTQAFIKSIKPSHVELGVPEEYNQPVFKEDGTGTITKKEVVQDEVENPEE